MYIHISFIIYLKVNILKLIMRNYNINIILYKIAFHNNIFIVIYNHNVINL